MHATPVSRSTGGVIVSHVDITERKLAEEALRRSDRSQAEAEKLAATGRMAAQVAHEINNPLAGIKNSFRLIRDAVPKDHPDRDMVERIEREIDRIAKWCGRCTSCIRPGRRNRAKFRSARQSATWW